MRTLHLPRLLAAGLALGLAMSAHAYVWASANTSISLTITADIFSSATISYTTARPTLFDNADPGTSHLAAANLIPVSNPAGDTWGGLSITTLATGSAGGDLAFTDRANDTQDILIVNNNTRFVNLITIRWNYSGQAALWSPLGTTSADAVINLFDRDTRTNIISDSGSVSATDDQVAKRDPFASRGSFSFGIKPGIVVRLRLECQSSAGGRSATQ